MVSQEFIPKIRIEIGGKEQKDLVEDLSRLEVEDSIKNPSICQIILGDRDDKWVDSPLLNPEVGDDIKIYLGYADETTQPLFTGKIVALSPEYPNEGARKLGVLGYDHSFFLQKTHSLRDNSFQKTADIRDLLSRIAGINGLGYDGEPLGLNYADVVLIPPDASDYSIIRRIADMASHEFFVRDKKVYIRKPKYGDTAATLDWGTNIISMSFRMSTGRAVKKAIVRGYDPKEKRSYASEKTTGESGTFSGTLASSYVAASGFNSQILEQDLVFSNQQDVDKLASALIDRANNSLVEGRCELIGDPKIRAGRSVVINGAGKRFSGSYYIESARHTVAREEGYLLSLELRSMVTQTL